MRVQALLIIIVAKMAHAIAPIQRALTKTPIVKPPPTSPATQLLHHEPRERPPLSMLSIVPSRPTAAKVATGFLLFNGFLFRFLDRFVLENVLERDEYTGWDRVLARRIGRRFLALGAAAFHLFFLKGSPLTAMGTGGAVLLIDRTKRTHPSKSLHHDTVRGERFLDVIRLHVYSILAWSGVLHPILPWTQVAVRAVGCILGMQAAMDIFFPDKLKKREETNETAHLCQASGYALAGLSLFVVSLSSSPKSQTSSLNALGYACIANLYSLGTLFREEEVDDNASCSPSLLCRLRRGLYSVWLLTNGGIAARLASPGSSPKDER